MWLSVALIDGKKLVRGAAKSSCDSARRRSAGDGSTTRCCRPWSRGDARVDPCGVRVREPRVSLVRGVARGGAIARVRRRVGGACRARPACGDGSQASGNRAAARRACARRRARPAARARRRGASARARRAGLRAARARGATARPRRSPRCPGRRHSTPHVRPSRAATCSRRSARGSCTFEPCERGAAIGRAQRLLVGPQRFAAGRGSARRSGARGRGRPRRARAHTADAAGRSTRRRGLRA